MEGSAVFFETWMAGGLGRAQGGYDEMVFRAKVHDHIALLLAARAGERRHPDRLPGRRQFLPLRHPLLLLSRADLRRREDRRMAPPLGGFEGLLLPASSSTCSASRSTTSGTTGSRSSTSSRRTISPRLAQYPLTEPQHLSPRGLGSMSRGFIDEQDQQPDRRLPLPRTHRLPRADGPCHRQADAISPTSTA